MTEGPLEPGSDLYEPIYKPTDDHQEPIDVLANHIYFTDTESLQLFSGFRGSGKTTELFRLKDCLEKADYTVIFANALNYINPYSEIDISDLLISLAGAFNDALENLLGKNLKVESYWTRIWNFLRDTNVRFDEISIGAGPATLKASLQASPSFRKTLQASLANHVAKLKADVDKFFEDGVKAIRDHFGDSRQIVLIFDSLEQIRGSLTKEDAVLRSVESLFTNHFDKLALPYVHVVYTVPPWLKFFNAPLGRLETIPSVKQWHNNPERTLYEPGMKSLRALVHRRLGEGGKQRLFGDAERADRFIEMCGGHIRDLIRMLAETILRAQALPISDSVVDRALITVRNQYLPISIDDAFWLDRIATTRRPDHKNQGGIDQLSRFLDSHMVMYLKNGDEWYDIHPLIRDEVASIVFDYPSDDQASDP